MENKLTYEHLLESTTLFFVDQEVEKEYNKRIAESVNSLRNKLSQINSLAGLREYVKQDKNSLENILCLLDVSTEKFKRIITLLRINKKYTVTTEWSLTRTWKYMIENESFLNEVTELIFSGANNERFKEIIPKFYLDNFKIDIDVISRLSNNDDLIRLVKGNIETTYNNDIANAYYRKVTDSLINASEKNGFDYELKSTVDLLNREVSFVIKHGRNIKMIIDISYIITTSSTQTNFAKKIKDTFLKQKECYSTDKEFSYAMIIDGAGWIARQSDLRTIYKSSNIICNINNLDIIKKAISNLN